MAKVQLHLPHHRYECTSCGRCCRAAWTIAVDRVGEEALRQSQTYQSQQRSGYQPLKTVSERVALARDENNACLFLTSDNFCEIHAELGGTQKPIVCQTYPYLFTETPDGVYTSLSYACPAVLEGQGGWVEEQRAALETLLELRWDDLPRAASVGNQVEICRDLWWEWSDYLQLETRLLELFSADDPAGSLLELAGRLLFFAKSHGLDALSESVVAAPSRFAGFDQQLLAMVSCNLIAVTEDGLTDPQERAQLGNLLWNGGAHVSSKLGVKLRGFTLLKPHRPELSAVVESYVRQAIFGKRLLKGTVVSRLLAMACGLSILLFYQKALEDREVPRAFDESKSGGALSESIDRAFTLMESELMSHTVSFDGFFSEFEEALTQVRDSLYPPESTGA